ncbi:MAG TPA: flavin monoamine oxidase family protein [Acidimicrobiia bacterium]|jgi:monoamine oxidase
MATDRIETEVCVVGAGYAGLTAARRLSVARRDVVVLEARDRVGGRVWTRHTSGGVPIDMGGTFFSPKHERALALAAEVGATVFPTNVVGDTVLATGGKVQRYATDKTPRINPLALASFGQAMARLDAMARRVPLDAPWDAPHAASWDATSAARWLSRRNVPTRGARDLMEATLRALFCCDLAEVSLLNVLFLLGAGGGLLPYMSIEGGYQHFQMRGGMQTVAERVAADLGDRVRLTSPVEAILQRDEAVDVVSPSVTVSARRVVVTIPPALAGHVRYDPPLPADKALLLHQLPAGTEVKAVVVYDEPFWRHDGLCGASVALDDEYEVTLDTTPPDSEAGVIALYAAGPKARRLAAMTPEGRRDTAVDTLVRRFGRAAASPVEVDQVNWVEQEWTRGCSMAHFGTGTLTQYGHELRRPVGRVHFAGTETATVSHGAIDGAVRSGERVADEVLADLGVPGPVSVP